MAWLHSVASPDSCDATPTDEPAMESFRRRSRPDGDRSAHLVRAYLKKMCNSALRPIHCAGPGRGTGL